MENKSLEFLDLSLFHPWLLKRKQNLQNSRDFKFCKINWNHRGIPMPKTKTLYVKCNYVDGKFHMIFFITHLLIPMLPVVWLIPLFFIWHLQYIFIYSTFHISFFNAECPWKLHFFKPISFWNITYLSLRSQRPLDR